MANVWLQLQIFNVISVNK